jgi:single-strand DNA-binding protein
MLNRVVLVGRMTRDPELRYTNNNNIPVVSFTLAVNKPFSSNRDNDNDADFISCTAWRRQAEVVSKYTHKGSMVAVDGRLQTRNYMDERNNVRRYVTEVVCDSVVFLDPKGSNTNNGPSDNSRYDNRQNQNQRKPYDNRNPYGSDSGNNQKDNGQDDDDMDIDIIEDDLPF